MSENYPRHKQFVRVTLKDGTKRYARFSAHMVTLADQPGYELRGPQFYSADEIVSWEPADDPLGYDLSMIEWWNTL